jgi:hypothetical protein
MPSTTLSRGELHFAGRTPPYAPGSRVRARLRRRWPDQSEVAFHLARPDASARARPPGRQGGFPARPARRTWLGLRVGFGGTGVRRVVDDVHPHAELPTAVNIPALPLGLSLAIGPVGGSLKKPAMAALLTMFRAPQ